jgi:HEAT repeat protein
MVENDEVLEDIKRALGEVCFTSEGKIEPSILKALTDEQPVRRALAAEVLGQRGAEPRDVLRKMLEDPRGSVKLRAALALSGVKEEKAISVLISILADLPTNLARDAEEYLVSVAAEQAPKVPITADAAEKQKAKAAWEAWWKKSEGGNLLDEIKKRTMTEAQREQAMELIKKLKDENFKVRLQSREDLMKMGVVVVPLLRKAIAAEADPELKEKARMCLIEIEKIAPGSLSPVFPRLIAFRKPAGAVEALLAFLPFADEEVVMTEVQGALNVLAFPDGKPSPALVAALKDKLSTRRAAAAEALCSAATAKELEEVRKLLKDSETAVRVRAAIALATARDQDSVSMLIQMIPELTGEQANQAEDFLSRLAGDDTPSGAVGNDAAAREKRRDLWAAWWKEKGSKTSLAALLSKQSSDRYLGLTMVISPNHSKIMEIGPDGKTRWEINGLSNVWDVDFLSRNRLLVMESGARKVTERTTRGDVLWEMTVPGNIYPTGIQKTSNGNMLFIASNRLVEITRGGKEVFGFNRPQSDILHARKMRDGQIIYVTSSSTVHRIDASGNEVKSWRVNNPTNQGCHILPNGNVLFPQQYANRVFEYDMNGQQVWTATATQPTSVYRLPNGNTLIGCGNPFQVIEVDRAGKEVWKVTTPIQPLRVSRR